MMRAFLILLALCFSVSACNLEKDSIDPKQQSALELSRTLFSNEDFNEAVNIIAQKSDFYMSDSEIDTGKLDNMGLSKNCLHKMQSQLAKQMQGTVSYTDTVQNMSEFYYKHFSKTEMDKLTQFFSSSLGEKFSQQVQTFQKMKPENFNPFAMLQNLTIFQQFIEIASSELAQKSIRLLPEQASHTFNYLQQTLLNEKNTRAMESVMKQTLSQAMQQGGCGSTH